VKGRAIPPTQKARLVELFKEMGIGFSVDEDPMQNDRSCVMFSVGMKYSTLDPMMDKVEGYHGLYTSFYFDDKGNLEMVEVSH
jgi:hypothetical protein